MNDLIYTITNFDTSTNELSVTFGPDERAVIQLCNPLPKNQGELEEVIKFYAKPQEAIESVTAPDADLSYITPLLGIQANCPRRVVNPAPVALTAAQIADIAAGQAATAAAQDAAMRALIEKILIEQKQNAV